MWRYYHLWSFFFLLSKMLSAEQGLKKKKKTKTKKLGVFQKGILIKYEFNKASLPTEHG